MRTKPRCRYCAEPVKYFGDLCADCAGDACRNCGGPKDDPGDDRCDDCLIEAHNAGPDLATLDRWAMEAQADPEYIRGAPS